MRSNRSFLLSAILQLISCLDVNNRDSTSPLRAASSWAASIWRAAPRAPAHREPRLPDVQPRSRTSSSGQRSASLGRARRNPLHTRAHRPAGRRSAGPPTRPHDQPRRSRRGWGGAASRTPLNRNNVAKRGLDRAAEAAALNGDGMPKLGFHDPRHTFASHLIRAGVDPVRASRQLRPRAPEHHARHLCARVRARPRPRRRAKFDRRRLRAEPNLTRSDLEAKMRGLGAIRVLALVG